MGKIVRQGVEYGGSSNSADCIKYNDTKSVKEAIDEIKASSSSNPTASSVTFNNTDTGLAATNVQDAITEVNGNLPKEWKLISTVTTLSAIGSGKGLTIPDLSSYKELLILTNLSYFETSETYPIINGHINSTGYTRPGCYLGSSSWQTCTIYISDEEINASIFK